MHISTRASKPGVTPPETNCAAPARHARAQLLGAGVRNNRMAFMRSFAYHPHLVDLKRNFLLLLRTG